MADASGGSFITQKVGPLPLVVWVMGGAGVVFLFILMKGRSSSSGTANATNQVSALAPTEAEAFGTIEQQQQDVTNALTTLGQNQAALGGSLQTISGTIDTNQNYNAAQFANILGGVSQVEQGQTAASNQATNYYNSVLQNMLNYYNSLYTTTVNGDQGISQQVSGAQQGINYISGQVSGVATTQQQQQAALAQIDNWVNEIKARLQQGDYSAARWGPSNQPWTTASSPLAA